MQFLVRESDMPRLDLAMVGVVDIGLQGYYDPCCLRIGQFQSRRVGWWCFYFLIQWCRQQSCTAIAV